MFQTNRDTMTIGSNIMKQTNIICAYLFFNTSFYNNIETKSSLRSAANIHYGRSTNKHKTRTLIYINMSHKYIYRHPDISIHTLKLYHHSSVLSALHLLRICSSLRSSHTICTSRSLRTLWLSYPQSLSLCTCRLRRCHS